MPPKISVIVPGRLHAFDMALYFQKHNMLNELVTGYPKRYVVPFGINRAFIKSIYVNEIINRTTNFLGLGYPVDHWACDSFDWIASKVVKLNSDVYFIWSGYGEFTIKKIRKKNPKAKIIIVRGSTHILEHEALLKKINNTNRQQISPRIIQKELKEYLLADYITVPSTFALQSFIKNGINENKLFLNMLGVDLVQFPFKQKNVLDENTIVFGNVGNISKQKNVEAIIDAIGKIWRKNKNVKLILAGAIEKQSFNEKKLKQPFINYKGKLPQNELHNVYRKIDIFIINSVQEGMAMVQLQAMSSGCPIISTENAGAEDLIQPLINGIIIPAFDNDALINAIQWFIDHKCQIKEMSLKSRAVTVSGFTWDDFGKRNMDFVQKITQ